MIFSPLPLSSLPAWSKLNNVDFLDTAVSSMTLEIEMSDHSEEVVQRGIITTRALSSVDTFDIPTLLEIPKELVLCREFLLEERKLDSHFEQLRELVGWKSFRLDIMLFLLMQMTIARNNTLLDCSVFEGSETGKCDNCNLAGEQECLLSTVTSQTEENINVGVSNPWSEYVRFLPETLTIPTMWNDAERMLLIGTSLEISVDGKMGLLSQEFEDLREKTIGIPWCNSCWWQDGSLEPLLMSDWIRLDAWYRSRSLELPSFGEVMVPCLDMANHSFESNAYWDETSNGNVSLLLRPDMQLDEKNQITINYGDTKSHAETLYSYGFQDKGNKCTALVLNVSPQVIDPLHNAKVAATHERPVVRICRDEDGEISWESPYLYFFSLNEEDGLEFKTLQEVDGSHGSLCVFWQEADVTESVDTFETLISGHELADVFKVRVLSLLHDRIQQQVARLYASTQMAHTLVDQGMVSVGAQIEADGLREIETDVLEVALETISGQKTELLETESVCQYLRSMSSNAEQIPAMPEPKEEDDFS
ncbi:hypothetical protein SBOR_2782 [Sclerotinia borealis F-4128]|uniref:SET domain-containing protein n=1 Tax=Sclerotinia borealis (strain F-4128) TaxID=1432307 RepID=W9CQG2_SCLBF|nr:hypothetical protein SBOR_2782 [Sclerotinia borealis F-4128]